MQVYQLQLNQLNLNMLQYKKITSPATKTELMRFIGSMNFYSNFVEELHGNLKPLMIYFMTILNFRGRMN